MGVTLDGGESACRNRFPAKPCDYCKSTAALLFCRPHSAFMCMTCDAKLHNAGSNTHAKVWMCEVCEQAPAAVTCRADAAALCVACDGDIHSANPLAQRHERTEVVPFYDTAESVVMKSTASIFAAPESDSISDRKLDRYIPDLWLSNNSIPSAKLPVAADAMEMKSMEFLFQDSDQILDFNSYQICSQPYSDSIVPVQTTVKAPQLIQQHSPESRFEIDFTRSNITSYNNSYTTASLSHSVITLNFKFLTSQHQ